jgi:hypothetical protein
MFSRSGGEGRPLMFLKPMQVSVLAVLCWSLGCSGVSVRADGSPGPQECSDRALEVMKLLNLRPGDTASIVVDANKEGQEPMSITDGPVEGSLSSKLGPFPEGTLLYGQIWTGGPEVVIRYYEARYQGGERVPLCGVARESQSGLVKLPGSRPGVAVIEDDFARIAIVDAFR